MSTWVYSFTKFPGSTIIRPWINIKIINPINNKEQMFSALLDTGADRSVFPQAVCDVLELPLTPSTPKGQLTGIDGKPLETFLHPLKIVLIDPKTGKDAWKSKEVIIDCIPQNNIPPILGFENFMCFFKITFNHASHKIIIDDHPKV